MVFKELSLVSIDEKTYLCKLVEKEDGNIVLEFAEEENSTTNETIRDWILSYNINDLETIECSKLQTYSIKQLKQKEKLYFENKWNIMQEIKKIAVAKLENKYFKDEEKY